MAVVVMKFGGTSVANVERIRNVARHVKREVDAGNKSRWWCPRWRARPISSSTGRVKPRRCMMRANMMPSLPSGEQITAGLLAIVLQSRWVFPRAPGKAGRSRSTTNPAHGAARIEHRRHALKERFAQGEVAVITGFQGIGTGAQPDCDAWPGRIRYQRRRRCHRAEGRHLRYLHGRGRNLYDRSADRAESAAMEGSPMRKCWRWRRSARKCYKRARSSWPWCMVCGHACFQALRRRRA